MMTSARPSGSTVTRQPELSFFTRRFAFVTVPLVTSKNEPRIVR